MFVSSEYAAYLDDSGHPDDQDVVLVAGWVGKVEQWLLWEHGWTKVLSDFDIKSGVFHMTDFESAPTSRDPSNEYRHLSQHEREIFHNRLINHIHTRAEYHFATMVPIRDYREVNDIYYFEEWLGKPYSFAAVGVVQKLQAWKNRYASNDPLVTFFEDGTKHKGDLMQVFKNFKFDDPIFRKKKDVVPLQAADMLAWECFHAFNTGDVRPQFNKLLDATPGRNGHGIFSTDRLIQATQETTPPVPRRDPNRKVGFYYTSTPKVVRLRQITDGPRDDQIRGKDRAHPSIRSSEFVK